MGSVDKAYQGRLLTAYKGLMTQAAPEDQGVMAAFLELDSEAACQAIHETSTVLMGAKSIKVVPDDAAFTRLCSNLVGMSLVYPQVRRVFTVACDADRDCPGDELMDPAMARVVAERIERVTQCLG